MSSTRTSMTWFDWRPIGASRAVLLRNLGLLRTLFAFAWLLSVSIVATGCQQATLLDEKPTLTDEQASARRLAFRSQPVLRQNPIERVPLVRFVDFQSSLPTKAKIEIDDGQRQWQIDVPEPAYEHCIAVLGCYSNRQHRITVTIVDQLGRSATAAPLTFSTPPLPGNFPPLEITVSDPAEMEPGIRLFGVNLWIDSVSMNDYGYLVATDVSGQPVWYCDTGDRIADSRVLRNGNIVYQHGSYRYLYEIDILGRDLRSWYAARSVEPPNPRSIPVDVDTLHHDLTELPSGNFLTLATELRKFTKYPTDEFDATAPMKATWAVCDEVIEFEPDTGKVVERLALTNLLDTQRFGHLCLNQFWQDKYDEFIDSECRDWSHANGLQYLPDQNAILISVRHQDCVMLVDWQTKKTRWILGDPKGWSSAFTNLLLQPTPGLTWFYHQHAPRLNEGGEMLMYDNGNYRCMPYDQPTFAPDNASRVVQYRIDEEQRQVHQVYSYGAEQGDRFYSPFYGEAEKLPRTHNLLVTDGGHIESSDGEPMDAVPGQRQWARIFEIKSGVQPEKVFELRCASPIGSQNGWSIYRCAAYPSLSDPFRVEAILPNERPTVHPRLKIRKRNPLNYYTPAVVRN